MQLGGDIFPNLFDGLEGYNISDWEGRCEGEVSTEKGQAE